MFLFSAVPEEKPKDGFTKGLENQHCLEGETVTLTCEVTKPGAKVKWFKDGKEIKPDGKKYEVVVDGKVHKLIIHDTKPEDQTEYSAKFGDATTSCSLVVDGRWSHTCCRSLGEEKTNKNFDMNFCLKRVNMIFVFQPPCAFYVLFAA